MALNLAWLWFPGPLMRLARHLAYLSRLARWLKEHPAPKYFPDRFELYKHLIVAEGLDAPIQYLEFGVYQGRSLRYWTDRIKHPEARFIGFDCFEGLPERWGKLPEGTFKPAQVPKIEDERCSLNVGLFQDTLPGFLQRNRFRGRKVLHLDADLYSSTLFVLASMAPYLRSGDVLIFDEFGSIRTPTEEFRAFEDFCLAFRLSFEVLGITDIHARVAMKLL